MTFHFNAANHRYTLDDKPLPGVTTIVRILDKPGLLQWAADEALSAISKVKEPTPQDYEAARFAWRDKRDKAGENGTNTHDLCEKWVRWCIQYHKGYPESMGMDGSLDPVRPFITWAIDNDIRFIDCEVVQYSEEHWYAGRFDLLYEFKGEIWLGDIKSSNGVYAEYFAQLGGYDIMCAERGVKVDHRAGLHLNKDTCTVHPSYDQERDREFFLSCLRIYKILNTFGK